MGCFAARKDAADLFRAGAHRQPLPDPKIVIECPPATIRRVDNGEEIYINIRDSESHATIENADGVPLYSSSDNLPVNIYGLANCLSSVFGWNLNSLQNPASLHVCVTRPMVDHIHQFIVDVKRALYLCRKDPDWNLKGKVGIYGTAANIPAGIAEELTKVYMHSSTKVATMCTSSNHSRP